MILFSILFRLELQEVFYDMKGVVNEVSVSYSNPLKLGFFSGVLRVFIIASATLCYMC
jgi:hypothetical protein